MDPTHMRLLRKAEIKTEVARVTEMMTAGIGLSVQRIIAERMKIAFAKITDYARFGQEEYVLYRNKDGTLNYVDLVNLNINKSSSSMKLLLLNHQPNLHRATLTLTLSLILIVLRPRNR